MTNQINRNLVTFGVQRQISCPTCERILDTRDAVLFRACGQENIRCGRCFDLIIATAISEVIDGRVVNGPRVKGPVKHNPIHQYDVKIGSRYHMRHTSGDITVKVLHTKTTTVYGRNRSNTRTHFVCQNEKTGREIVVRSASKFRSEVSAL